MTRSRRRLIRDRAGGRCEYCQLPDYAASTSTFHVEHVIAKQHRGTDDTDNLCWSCHWCNLHKGPNLSGRDTLTGNVVRLFDPRTQEWRRHFEWQDTLLFGRTQTGRATIATLRMNDENQMAIRRWLTFEEQWPPAEI